MKNQKSYGLDWEKELAEQSEKDWVFSGFSDPCIADIPESERDLYLPKGELQYTAFSDMQDCASRAPVNKLEAKFNYLLKKGQLLPQNEAWFREHGYITENGFELSDAFIAILSGTTKQGNSLKAPLDAIRKHGLIPKRLLPLEQNMSWEAYHDPQRITGSMRALGQAFLQRFSINYEKVYETHYKGLLLEDLLIVGGFAWPQPKDGEYPKSDNSPNHAFVLFKNPAYYAFDNYVDSTDGDFVKKLAPDYKFYEHGYRVYISAQMLPSDKNWIAQLISNLWQAFFPLKEEVIKLEPKPEPMQSNEDKLLKVAIMALDTDVTPQDNIPDDVACAETISTLLKKVFPDFPILPSTKDLDMKMFLDKKRFKRITEPKRGAIIVSPRTETVNGHVGLFVTTERIASNNSGGKNKGKFTGNYDYQSWIKDFKEGRGLRIYLYEVI